MGCYGLLWVVMGCYEWLWVVMGCCRTRSTDSRKYTTTEPDEDGHGWRTDPFRNLVGGHKDTCPNDRPNYYTHT